GSKHRFYDTLHPGETAIASIRYTRDSSYLRMTEPSATTKLVEFPNGTRHLYQKDDTLSNLGYTKYNLRYIYDSFSSVSNGVPTSNYVQFDYTYTTDATGTWISQWTITDTA